MSSSELLVICVSAFLAVFVLLGILALLMRLILVVFPAKQSTTDTAAIAAMTALAQSMYPGMKVTRVEELK